MYRIPRGDLQRSDPMDFGQTWYARIPVPISDIGDLGLAFLPCFAALETSDFIRITAFEDVRGRSFGRAIEVAEFIVALKDDDGLEIVPFRETVQLARYTSVEKSQDRSRDALRIVRSGAAFEVQDAKGNSIETFVDREQAKEFAEREGDRMKGADTADPDKSAPAPDGRYVKRGFRRFEIRDKDDTVLDTFRTKAEAEDALVAG